MLPFTDDEFDLVIFNASFHYSENYEKTVAEALRCTSAGGTILIADTPWYSNEASGEQMVIERRRAFTQRYGISIRQSQQPRIPHRSTSARTGSALRNSLAGAPAELRLPLVYAAISRQNAGET